MNVFYSKAQFQNRLFLFQWLSQSKIVSEYDQEIPQSQTADNPVAPRGRVAQPSRDISAEFKTKPTNMISFVGIKGQH